MHPRCSRPPGQDRPGCPPFRWYAGLHDRALEVALRRYCTSTTGPVIVERSDRSGPTARDVVVLARLARQLGRFGRSLVVTAPRASAGDRIEPAPWPGVGTASGPEPSGATRPYTPVA